MSEQEILEILLKFKDSLSQGWIVMDVFRGLGWIIILGLGWLVDSLQSITDSILGLKTFFADSEVSSLVKMLQPLSIILMAFSLLYTGYLLIFQKKVDREGIIVNVFLALVVIVLLGSGMEQANRFTDDAVSALNGDDKESLANGVIKQGLLDVALYDLQGWENPEIDPKNNIPEKNVRDIDINSYLTDGTKITKEEELSSDGVEILSNKLDTLGDGSHGLIELDDGNFITSITKEYYYRYSVDWFTIMVTLAITAFTLLTIAIKLAKLFFELTFNYILATIIAPADIHSGQKTKQVIQNILNIFMVTIMIFLSMKIYLLGTAFIDEKLTGLPYLIALFAFSLAVIDGPNIVERLFGIDAGLKSGWGALAGAYAGGKGLSKGVQGLSSAGKSAALKGVSGVAGVAGMAKGLSSTSKDQEQQKDQANDKQNGKGEDINANKNGNGQGVNGENQDSKIEGQEELEAGKNEAASTLEQDMKNGDQSKVESGQQPQGLHQEMASKGIGNSVNRQTPKNATPNNINSNSPSGNGSVMSTPNGKLNEQGSAGLSGGSPGSSSTVNGSSGSPSVSSMPSTSGSYSGSASDGSTSSIPSVSSMPSTSGSYSSSTSDGSTSSIPSVNAAPSPSPTVESSTSGNNEIPTNTGRTQETQVTRETRHIGNVVSDKVRTNNTFQKVQRSYQIGENTGDAVRRNIAKFSRKNRGE